MSQKRKETGSFDMDCGVTTDERALALSGKNPGFSVLRKKNASFVVAKALDLKSDAKNPN